MGTWLLLLAAAIAIAILVVLDVDAPTQLDQPLTALEPAPEPAPDPVPEPATDVARSARETIDLVHAGMLETALGSAAKVVTPTEQGTYLHFHLAVLHFVAQHQGLAIPSDINGRARALTGWDAGEEPAEHGAANNPENTTYHSDRFSGATCFNSVGVRNYETFADGVLATALTLVNGFYQPIIDALFAETFVLADLVDAVVNSPWGTQTLGPPSDEYANDRVPSFPGSTTVECR